MGVEPPSHVWLFAVPWTVAHQAPLSVGFSRQEYWSGLPFPPPGDLPETEINGRFFTTEPPGKPSLLLTLAQSTPFFLDLSEADGVLSTSAFLEQHLPPTPASHSPSIPSSALQAPALPPFPWKVDVPLDSHSVGNLMPHWPEQPSPCWPLPNGDLSRVLLWLLNGCI